VPAGDAIERTPTAPIEPAPADSNTPTMADPDTALYGLAALDELAPRGREAIAPVGVRGTVLATDRERMGIRFTTSKRGALRHLRQLCG
jgi:hypothetical protein